VRSKDNPADLGTRGSPINELKESTLWWNGPQWLSLPKEKWPISCKPECSPPESRVLVHCCTQSDDEDQCLKFTSYYRALRATARILSWHPRHKRTAVNMNALTKLAKTRLVIAAQKMHYPEEYTRLLKNKVIPSKSSLSPLNPFIDNDGQIRVNSRLVNSNLPYNENHPVLLPPNSALCTLFIKFVHQILLHAENRLMLRCIRQEFYIPRLTNKVKNCIRKCITCTRFKQRTSNQIMAALPSDRVTFTPAFTITGVDFAGPFDLKTSAIRSSHILKGYVAVFVCFSTKAVHLESVSELSTKAFLATFERF
ncbi:hypothetical protein KR059_011158, partial [Drosophila kikkawai]